MVRDSSGGSKSDQQRPGTQNIVVGRPAEPTNGVILLVRAERLLYCPLRL